jgi:hypothetical protein
MENKRMFGVLSDKEIAEIVAEEIRMEKLDAQRDLELNRIHRGCCPRHGERIHYGMFDALCGACEYEADTGEEWKPAKPIGPFYGPIQQPNFASDDILF